eukprot:scaffold45149_cov63-Phaeocystis_antarctica.AAC.6
MTAERPRSRIASVESPRACLAWRPRSQAAHWPLPRTPRSTRRRRSCPWPCLQGHAGGGGACFEGAAGAERYVESRAQKANTVGVAALSWQSLLLALSSAHES